MNAGLLDVLHHAADDRARAVAQAIDVDLDGRLRETCRSGSACPARRPIGAVDVASQCVLVVDDLHRPAAEDEARPHQHRDSRFAGRRGCACCRSSGGAVGRLLQARARRSASLNRSRSSAMSMLSTLVPMIGTPAASSALRQVQRRLPAELHDHALPASCDRRCSARPRPSAARRRDDRWCRSRSTDGLRIRVDHDASRSRPRAARTRPGSSSSRTRSPGRCGSGPPPRIMMRVFAGRRAASSSSAVGCDGSVRPSTS